MQNKINVDVLLYLHASVLTSLNHNSDKKFIKSLISKFIFQYAETNYEFKFGAGMPTERPLIKMVQGKRTVQILNHQPLYRKLVSCRLLTISHYIENWLVTGV